MTARRSVLWHNPFDRSAERCQLRSVAGGWLIDGLVLIPVDGQPARCDYRVEIDGSWRARRVHLRLTGHELERELELGSSGESWTVDGAHDPTLDGCTDVDLRVSPSTNTLPIRRLGLAVGEQAPVRAAWVGFPDLVAAPTEQSYERVAERAYRYRSGTFVADLRVDEAGVVLDYGDEYWRAEAVGPPR